MIDSVDITNRDNKFAACSLAAVGACYTSCFAFKEIKGLFKYCLLPRSRLNALYCGGFAIVTGASDGLGKEYARNLA